MSSPVLSLSLSLLLFIPLTVFLLLHLIRISSRFHTPTNKKQYKLCLCQAPLLFEHWHTHLKSIFALFFALLRTSLHFFALLCTSLHFFAHDCETYQPTSLQSLPSSSLSIPLLAGPIITTSFLYTLEYILEYIIRI